MAQKSDKVDALAEVNTKDQVIELALQGKQPAAIARVIGISRQRVGQLIDEALADSSEHLMAKAERLFLLNFMRIERLLETAMPLATGEYDDPDAEPDKPRKLFPDRNFGALAKDLIKLQIDATLRLAELRARVPEEGTDRITTTIVAHDDMYSTAQINMEVDWLESYADMDASDLLPDVTEGEIVSVAAISPVYDVVEVEKRLEKHITKLENTFKPEGDEEDDTSQS